MAHPIYTPPATIRKPRSRASEPPVTLREGIAWIRARISTLGAPRTLQLLLQRCPDATHSHDKARDHDRLNWMHIDVVSRWGAEGVLAQWIAAAELLLEDAA